MMSQMKNRQVVVVVILLLSLALGAIWTITDRPDDVEVDPLLEPQIIGQLPRSGEELSLDGTIDIYFNHPMNSTSVRLALSTRPYIRHESTWLDPQTLRLTPAEGTLRPDTTYTISLSTLARTQEGYALPEPTSIEFQTIGELLVQEVTPSDGVKGLDPEATISVIFNRPVVPLTLAENMVDLPDPIEFKPDIPGEGEWLTTNIYVWHPSEPLPGGQQYRATISKGFEGLFGVSLQRAYTWEFGIADPKVEAVYVDDSRIGIDNRIHLAFPGSQIKVKFTQSMDRHSTEAALWVVDKRTNREISGTFTWEDDDHLLVFTPDTPLGMDTTYQIWIEKTARNASGGNPLNNRKTAVFQTGPYPEIVEVSPVDGEQNVEWDYKPIYIEFNARMDLESLTAEDAIVFEPELKGRMRFYPSEERRTGGTYLPKFGPK